MVNLVGFTDLESLGHRVKKVDMIKDGWEARALGVRNGSIPLSPSRLGCYHYRLHEQERGEGVLDHFRGDSPPFLDTLDFVYTTGSGRPE